jgi:hypothetical protein
MKKVLLLCLASLLSLAVPKVAVASLTIDIPISADAFISYNNPTTNYGNVPDLTVSGTASSSSLGLARALINFNLSTMNIPQGYIADISYAGVFMFMRNEIPMSGVAYDLQAVTQPWSEYSVTWSSMPYSYNLSSASLRMNDWMSWEFSLELLESWVNKEQPFYGFLIKLNNEAEGKNSFNQREFYVGSGGYVYQETANYLHIEYTLQPAPVPIPGTVWLLGSGLIGLMAIRKKLKK